jgi:hypothetical protein
MVKMFSKFRQKGDSENEENSSDCDSVKEKSNLKKKMKRMCTFREKWLQEETFKTWLAKCDNLGMAKCVLCPAIFSIKSEGIGAVSTCSDRNTNAQWQLVLKIKHTAVSLMLKTLLQKVLLLQ